MAEPINERTVGFTSGTPGMRGTGAGGGGATPASASGQSQSMHRQAKMLVRNIVFGKVLSVITILVLDAAQAIFAYFIKLFAVHE